MPHTRDMSQTPDLLEILSQSIAHMTGQPIEQVRAHAANVKARWDAEDEAGIGEAMHERRMEWLEDGHVER